VSVFNKHGITHLSASNVNLFIAQPAMWCASYLMKQKTPVGPAAHRGSAIETGIEAGLFDPEMPVEACQKLADETFVRLTRLSTHPNIDKERSLIAGAVEVGLAELRQYGIPAKPETGRQHKIEVNIPAVPIPVVGYLDFYWPDHGIILDLKTSSRVPSSISDAHARQGAIYLKRGSNQQMRFAYCSGKKIAVYVLEEPEMHIAAFVRAVKSIETFLSLSDDSEKLTRALSPDLSSFYWNEPAARAVAKEIWG